jgi:hypothetical protein
MTFHAIVILYFVGAYAGFAAALAPAKTGIFRRPHLISTG